MDATFGTIDVKYHLFTLMAFDLHSIGVPIDGSSLIDKLVKI
jgi:hypothetical protein